MNNNIQLVRVLGGGLRLSALRGVYLDAEGEEVGAVVDCVEFGPDGQVQVILDYLEGEATDTFRPVDAEWPLPPAARRSPAVPPEESGQQLAPREQWGEETGEHWCDIVNIR